MQCVAKQPTSLFVCGAVLALLLTGCPKPRQVIEISVNCPHVTPAQAESWIAIPLELALAGMPGQTEITSVSGPGQVRIYLEYRMPPGTNHLHEIAERFIRAEETGEIIVPYTGPIVREIADVPPLADGPLTPMLEIQPNNLALTERGADEMSLWRAIAERCDPAEALDEHKLLAMTLSLDCVEVPLVDVAQVKQVTQPKQIARSRGWRLAELRGRQQKP